MMSISGRFGLVLVVLGLVNEGNAGIFGLSKRYDVFLCPEVRGTITMNGEPLSDVEVMREVFYDDEIVDHTVTSGTGEFSFEELQIKSRTPGKAFAEARTRQVLVADYAGKRYLLWLHITDSTVEEPLISKKLGTLRCDLSDEAIYHHFPRPNNADMTYNVKGVCRLL